MSATETPLAPPPTPGPIPRVVPRSLPPVDRLFHGSARTVGLSVLLLTGAIGAYLGYQAIPTLEHYGFGFFTQTSWQPELNRIGIAAVFVGTVEVALVAIVISFPLALTLALFVTEIAPRWLRNWLVTATDLMAAVPGIIYGLWGFFFLEPRAIDVARWLSQFLGWIPIFHVDTNPNAAVWQQSDYTGSAFIAGLAVSMMVVPLACSIMRSVFDQVPIAEREGALALGGTKFGVIRMVVLPFSRGGIIGAGMLALGRALGETAAVLVVISPVYLIKASVVQSGVQTISALIAGNFGNATSSQLSALLAAGFFLFLLTLAVNLAASALIKRSRSGAATQL